MRTVSKETERVIQYTDSMGNEASDPETLSSVEWISFALSSQTLYLTVSTEEED